MYFSSRIVSDLIDYAAYKGADVKKVKSDAQEIGAKDYIDYDLTSKYVTAIGALLEDDQLGLHIGELISLKVTENVDEIMQESSSLEDSFKNAVAYSKMISDALECELHKADKTYSVSFTEIPDWKVIDLYTRRQILDLTVLSALNSVVLYTGNNYHPVEIKFGLPRPKNISEYYRLFNCSISFNAPVTEVVFTRSIFDKHFKKTDYGLLKSLKEKVEVELGKIEQENELIREVKRIILSKKPERAGVNYVAQELHLSRRTLQRKLSDLNTSFKAIEHELQLKLSKQYLNDGNKSVDEISYLLGFYDSSSFIRFFKSKMGLSPTKFQQQHQG